MIEADRVHSTPRTYSSQPRDLDPKDVIADLLEELLFDDPQSVAEMVVERLKDAGFVIWPYELPKPPKAP